MLTDFCACAGCAILTIWPSFARKTSAQTAANHINLRSVHLLCRPQQTRTAAVTHLPSAPSSHPVQLRRVERQRLDRRPLEAPRREGDGRRLPCAGTGGSLDHGQRVAGSPRETSGKKKIARRKPPPVGRFPAIKMSSTRAAQDTSNRTHFGHEQPNCQWLAVRPRDVSPGF